MKFSLKRKDDKTAIEQGVWVSIDDEVFDNKLVIDDPGQGPAIKVASMTSKLYTTAYDKVTRGAQDVIRALNWVPPDIRKAAALAGLLAAVTDWRIQDEDGSPVPFSKEAAKDLITSQQEVYERLELVAGNLARYRKEEEAADAQNLSNTSGPALNGKATAGEESQQETSLH